MSIHWRGLAAWLIAALLVGGGWSPQSGPLTEATAAEAASTSRAFTQAQIEQLVAPIAIYPDSLIAQILMAATYPLEIVQASRWIEKNPGLKGKALENALASQKWDASVKSLTNFPDVLKRMSDNLDWTQDLGDAMLAQQEEVMNAIQRMRRYAYDSGNLKTTKEQKVVVQEKVIVVEPATEIVYVPAYSPTVVYGAAWAPPSYYYPIYSYPPSYWYPPGYVASNIISFGLGMAVGAAVWNNWNYGHCDWHGGNVNINNNFNFNRNINTGNINIGNKVGRGNYSNWQHNVNHRGGVRYRDSSTQQKFTNARLDSNRQGARIDRDTARGYDRPATRDVKRPDSADFKRAESRDNSRPATRDLRGAESRDLKRPETTDFKRSESRDFGQANRGSPSRQSNAFQVGDSGFDRSASQRGASSRGSSSFSGGGFSRGGGGGMGGGRGGGGGFRGR